MQFENEVGSGMLQSDVQQTCVLQECQITKTESKHPQWPQPYYFRILAKQLLKTVMKHSRSDLVSQQTRLYNNFIFGMLYWSNQEKAFIQIIVVFHD